MRFSRSRLHAVTVPGCFMATWFKVRTAANLKEGLGLKKRNMGLNKLVRKCKCNMHDVNYRHCASWITRNSGFQKATFAYPKNKGLKNNKSLCHAKFNWSRNLFLHLKLNVVTAPENSSAEWNPDIQVPWCNSYKNVQQTLVLTSIWDQPSKQSVQSRAPFYWDAAGFCNFVSLPRGHPTFH